MAAWCGPLAGIMLTPLLAVPTHVFPFESVKSAVTSFAEAITAAVYIERNPQHGQIVREIVEVSTIVERTAARPSFSPLFKFEQGKGLLPTGNRPMRPGFRATDLNIPESIFKVSL